MRRRLLGFTKTTRPKRIMHVLQNRTIPEEVKQKAWLYWKNEQLPLLKRKPLPFWQSLFLD